ncbi:MAG: class I SAM-dependent methyltransferase [Flavobacteriales bacterium]|nr:class I SAM-dependent methyltransferase [Flavobacteriales bacterium]
MEKNEVSKFYDEYVAQQIAKGYNERHLLLNDLMLKMGLQDSSSILELGCGIGTITSLLSKVVTRGKFVSVDISKDSIEHARKVNRNTNIEFIVSELLGFDYPGTQFDYVVLFDVLEHVPVEQHAAIFKVISGLMHEHSKLVIHVPSREIIRYNEKNCPELMQIIDQPLSEIKMIQDATDAGLRLEEFRFTNIWELHDYELFIFVKQFEFDKSKKTVAAKKSLFGKLKNKLK